MQPTNFLRITTLDESWADNGNVLHACFQPLTDCIEQEGLLTHWDWTADGKAEIKAELETRYAWWQQRTEQERAASVDCLYLDAGAARAGHFCAHSAGAGARVFVVVTAGSEQ